MIHFAWLPVFILFPLPLFMKNRTVERENSAAIKVPFFEEIKDASSISGYHQTKKKKLFLWLLWTLLVTAAARPQIPSGLQEYTVPVRDIMLVLDISQSMMQQDMGDKNKTRLDVVKEAAAAFINMRKNDRVGIILFSEQTSLYAPLTIDFPALDKMLSEVQAGLLGGLTSIGDALGLSLKYLDNSEAKNKIIVLLTDGINNAGNVAPEDALEIAKENGVTIYTIGVGSDFNQETAVDVAFLEQIAAETGGLFFMAKDSSAVTDAYAAISENEPLSKTSVYLMRQKELYVWPLFAFAAFISLAVFKRLAGQILFKLKED